MVSVCPRAAGSLADVTTHTELHMYNGLFGSHVAMVMRRLRRICSAVGNEDVRFVSCSATIENPIGVHMLTHALLLSRADEPHSICKPSSAAKTSRSLLKTDRRVVRRNGSCGTHLGSTQPTLHKAGSRAFKRHQGYFASLWIVAFALSSSAKSAKAASSSCDKSGTI